MSLCLPSLYFKPHIGLFNFSRIRLRILNQAFILYYMILYFTILYYTILYYTLYTIHYTLYTIHYTLYTIHYILYTIYYILYTIYYILYTIYYILYTILYYILYYTLMQGLESLRQWALHAASELCCRLSLPRESCTYHSCESVRKGSM